MSTINPQMNLLQGLNQSNFVSQFGTYADKFPYVQADGSASWQVVLVIVGAVISFVLGNGLTVFSYGEDPEKKTNKTTTNNIFFILGLMMVLIGSALGTEGLIRYLLEYLPQYSQWYQSLPENGKMAYQQMKAMDAVISSIMKK